MRAWTPTSMGWGVGPRQGGRCHGGWLEAAGRQASSPGARLPGRAQGKSSPCSLCVCAHVLCYRDLGALMMGVAYSYQLGLFHVYLTSCNEKPGDLYKKIKIKHPNCTWGYFALF